MTGLPTPVCPVVFVLVVLLAAVPAQRAHGQADLVAETGAELTWHDCAYAPDKRSMVRCGRLVIAGPAPASLPIVVVQHDPAGPSQSAMLYLQGGPGGSSWLEPDQFTWPSWARHAGLTQDLVIYNQRGTGLADPSLTCPEIQDVVRPALALGWYSKPALTLFDDATAACHARLIAEGHDLGQFSTLRNAHDVVAVMDALPYSDWTLFGTSYGSRLALAVMRMKPDGLRSVILDGVLPPDVPWWREEPFPVETTIAQIDAVCPMRLMNKPSCDPSTEDFLASLDVILDGLSDEPRRIVVNDWWGGSSYKVRVDPPVLLFALQSATAFADGANGAREAIVAAARGDYVGLDWLLESWAYEQIGFDLHDPVLISVTCDMYRSSPAEGLVGQASASGHYGAYVPQHSYVDHCAYWSEIRAPDIMRGSVMSAIPTLLFPGEYDSVTPTAWGERVAASLDHSHHFVVPRGGHAVLFDSPCAMKIMRAFLSDPIATPGSYCLEDMVPGARSPQ